MPFSDGDLLHLIYPGGVKAFICLLLFIGTLVFFAAPQERETISAGPFRVTVPTKYAKGAVVERVAPAPLYTSDEWETAKRDPSRVLKPHYGNRPQHWAIRLPSAAPAWYESDLKTAGEDPTAPQILIHKADEWSAVFRDGKVDAAEAAEDMQSMRTQFALLVEQPDRLPWSPAAVSGGFSVLVKAIRFNGGTGVRGVKQSLIEHDLLVRGRLHYIFLGLSHDGTCQIIATFPLDLTGLPDDSMEASHLGYSRRDYERLCREFDTYGDAAEQWLTANANQITPKLEVLDAVMAGLVVTHWE
jgi:hypothetical protein